MRACVRACVACVCVCGWALVEVSHLVLFVTLDLLSTSLYTMQLNNKFRYLINLFSFVYLLVKPVKRKNEEVGCPAHDEYAHCNRRKTSHSSPGYTYKVQSLPPSH